MSEGKSAFQDVVDAVRGVCVEATIVIECPSVVMASSLESLHPENVRSSNESLLRVSVDGSTSIKIAPPYCLDMHLENLVEAKERVLEGERIASMAAPSLTVKDSERVEDERMKDAEELTVMSETFSSIEVAVAFVRVIEVRESFPFFASNTVHDERLEVADGIVNVSVLNSTSASSTEKREGVTVSFHITGIVTSSLDVSAG